MGCCGSKCFYHEVYVDMLRRLNVQPTQTPDAASTTRRIAEFKRIASENRSHSASQNSVSVEMLRRYDSMHWKTSAVHTFNEKLSLIAAEDVTLLNGVGVGWIPSVLSVSQTLRNRPSIKLQQWDYRFWLLYMCEFYRLMSVFEKAKMLKNRDWAGVMIDEKKLKKCLNPLIAEVELAFASDLGPGDAFRPPNSATPEAVLSQVSLFLGDGSGTEPPENGISLMVLVRWLLLRHLNAMRTDEDNPHTREVSDSRRTTDVDISFQLSWYDCLQEKIKMLIEPLCKDDGYGELEKLFIQWTSGTRSLSEPDASKHTYEYFGMGDLFPDVKVHDDIVSMAYCASIKAQENLGSVNQRSESTITTVPTFAQFLQAYKGVLSIYYQAVKFDGLKRNAEPSYGIPPPSVSRGSLPKFMSKEDVEFIESAVVRVLAAKRKNAQIIPFPVLADAFLMRLLGQEQQTKSLGELSTVLGLEDPTRRSDLLELLHNHGWNDDLNPTSSFEVIQSTTELGLYSGLPDLACDLARGQWVSEISSSSPDDRLGDVNSPELLRLLHGIYGVFLTVGVLEKTPFPEKGSSTSKTEETIDVVEEWSGCEAEAEEEKEKSTHSDTLRDSTPLPMLVRREVLRETGASLNVPRLIQSAEEPDDGAVVASCATTAELTACVSRLYLLKKQMEWRESAIKQLRQLWPMDSSHGKRASTVFRAMARKNKREVVIDTDGEDTDMCPYINDLYEKYIDHLAVLVPRNKFHGICRSAARIAGNVSSGDAIITQDNLYVFSLYLLNYMEVLASFETGDTPTRDEVWKRFSCKFADRLDRFSFGVLFDHYAIIGTDTITVDSMAALCATLIAQRENDKDMLHIWVTEIRDVLPIHLNATDRAIRAEMAEIVTETDGYVLAETIETLLNERYGIDRVAPPEIKTVFVSFAILGTNKVLQRDDLKGDEIHSTDLRFLLLFIHTYLDVYIRGWHFLRAARKSLDKKAAAVWDNADLLDTLVHLLRSCELSGHININETLSDKSEPWSTSRLAYTLARTNVSASFEQYLKVRPKNYDTNTLWGRLRARLPVEDTPVHRLQRQKLFSYMDTCNRKFLTLADLMRGMLGVLSLTDFRDDLQPILFHAFVATKEVTFDKRGVVYLTSGNEQLITAPEFSVFLYYVWTFFQMYYMFDVLCTGCAEVTKEVPAAAFEREKATLKFWGIRLVDPIQGFASVNRHCQEGGRLFFAGFVEWAAEHRLTPEGYSHKESMDYDTEGNGVGDASM